MNPKVTIENYKAFIGELLYKLKEAHKKYNLD